MHDLLLVHVLERVAQLHNDPRRVLLGVAPLGDDAVEELAARDKLHHKHHLLRLVEDLEQLLNARLGLRLGARGSGGLGLRAAGEAGSRGWTRP